MPGEDYFRHSVCAGPPHPVLSNLELGSPCRALEASGNNSPHLNHLPPPTARPSLTAVAGSRLLRQHFSRRPPPPSFYSFQCTTSGHPSSNPPTPITNALDLASGGGVAVRRRVDRSLQCRLWCVRERWCGTVLAPPCFGPQRLQHHVLVNGALAYHHRGHWRVLCISIARDCVSGREACVTKKSKMRRTESRPCP